MVNLEYEYKSCDEEQKGCVGDTKWAIITDLSEAELKDKYADIIQPFTPFVLLTLEQGEIIKELLYFSVLPVQLLPVQPLPGV